jgi:hypothetical protein
MGAALTDVVAALVQRVALVEGGLDVARLVADVAAGEGAGGGLDLGFDLVGKGRCRDGQGADQGDEGGNELGQVNVAVVFGLRYEGGWPHANHFDAALQLKSFERLGSKVGVRCWRRLSLAERAPLIFC